MLPLTVLAAWRWFVSTLDLQTGWCPKYCWDETTVLLLVWLNALPRLALTLEGLGWLHSPQANSRHTHTLSALTPVPLCPLTDLVKSQTWARAFDNLCAETCEQRKKCQVSEKFIEIFFKVKNFRREQLVGDVTFVTCAALFLLGKVESVLFDRCAVGLRAAAAWWTALPVLVRQVQMLLGQF